nr:MAG TPA: HNH endonuclease bacteriophage, HNH Endonuclease, DNA.52A [Caudoviricetes sp.]
MRSYSELIKLTTYDERLHYLELFGEVGKDTFGFDRYLNQNFYRSREWKQARAQTILRDNGFDLGLLDYPIPDGEKILIHHMNPMTKDDILKHPDILLDTEYLISVTHHTHNLIHYGYDNVQPYEYKPRSRNDTLLW